MSRFTGKLIIEEIKPGILWKLKEPIVFEIEQLGSGKIVEVPVGFITDGTSIPKFLRVFLAVWGTYGRAATVHDYLYSTLRGPEMHKYIQTRKQADDAFFDGMTALGTGKILKYLIYWSVRMFGWYALNYTETKHE